MPNRSIIIRSIGLLEDGVMLEYVDGKTDLRASGLTLNHTMFVPMGEDYDDEIETLIDAARALLADALEDFRNVEPMDLEQMAEEHERRLAEEAGDE